MQYNAQSQVVNVAAYPQLCGSWPGDEWPEDILFGQYADSAELCAELPGEYKRDNVKLQRNYGRVKSAKSSVPK
jgi:hypothetical protein